MTQDKFWETKTLAQMSHQQWEALCDGCGKCCLHKLINEDTDELSFTNVACTLLNLETAQCSDYAHRRIKVPDCVRLTAKGASSFPWLPKTCAYRLLSEGQPLPTWHYLNSGSPESVHQAGISVRNRTVKEDEVIDFEDHIVGWDDL